MLCVGTTNFLTAVVFIIPQMLCYLCLVLLSTYLHIVNKNNKLKKKTRFLHFDFTFSYMCGNTQITLIGKLENVKAKCNNHTVREREEVEYVQQPPIELAALIFLYNLQNIPGYFFVWKNEHPSKI